MWSVPNRQKLEANDGGDHADALAIANDCLAFALDHPSLRSVPLSPLRPLLAVPAAKPTRASRRSAVGDPRQIKSHEAHTCDRFS
jgi:hypothetical protein